MLPGAVEVRLYSPSMITAVPPPGASSSVGTKTIVPLVSGWLLIVTFPVTFTLPLELQPVNRSEQRNSRKGINQRRGRGGEAVCIEKILNIRGRRSAGSGAASARR